jgi:hypothetical protein
MYKVMKFLQSYLLEPFAVSHKIINNDTSGDSGKINIKKASRIEKLKCG